MSEEIPYGFECKNADCKAGIIFGRYLTRPQRLGDVAILVRVNPGRLKCPKCGQEYRYDQSDLQEFPKTADGQDA